jgi:hypothetical protein
MLFKSLATAVLGAALLLGSSLVRAENFQSFGDYDIHYNAFTSDFLSPQVAQTYKVQRSKNRAILVVSVLKKVMGTPSQGVSGILRVTAHNLSGQLRNLDVRKIEEGTAIYYLATFPVNNEETMDFEIQVTPQGRDAPYVVKFRQQFFTD